MSSIINIARRNTSSATDQHYRYRRNAIDIRYHSTKKQTYLTNLPKISAQLKIDIDTLTHALAKKIGKHLNCRVTCTTDKENNTVNFYFTGLHNQQSIDNILQDMIEKYILCEQCDLPEYDGRTGQCKACGFSKSERRSSSHAIDDNHTTNDTHITQEPTRSIIPFWEIELSAEMDALYNRRAVLKDLCRDYTHIDHLLDDAWNVNNEKEFTAWKKRKIHSMQPN